MRRTETIFILFYTVVVTFSFFGWGQIDIQYPFCPEYNTERDLSAVIPPPEGYHRIVLEPDKNYSEWIRHLPLKPEDSPVLSWRGDTLSADDEVVAVIDLDIPNNLYQCADVAMRLWAEHLWSQNRQGDIRFRSLSGVDLNWEKWLEEHQRQPSRQSFLQYMNRVMASCNTASLSRDLSPVTRNNLLPGDMYIQPDPSGRGGIGHLSILFDIATNERGERIYLFGFGFMPAQDLHLVRPSSEQGIGDWFTIEGYEEFSSIWGEGSYFRFNSGQD